MGSSRVEQALNELDPGSRAVVDLSLGTDFSDENIATLIRVEPDEVARRRDRAIDALQQKLGGASHDDVVLELCAAMGVEPPATMLEGGPRNGSVTALANGDVPVADGPVAAAEAPTETEESAEAHSEAKDPIDSAAVGEPSPDAPAPEDVAAETAEPAADPVGDSEESTDDAAPPAGAAAGVIAVPFEPGETDAASGGPALPPESESEADADPQPEPEPEDRESRYEDGREPAVVPPPPPSSDATASDSERSGSRRRVGVLLAAAVAGVIAIGGVVALSSGGGSESEPVEPDPSATEAPSDPPGTAEQPSEEPEVSATLDALPDAPADGEAEVALEGDRLTVTLDGLPAPSGTYEAWLFTSVLDSRPLGSTGDGSGEISARLPESADRYEYLDVSLQPSGNAQHSGQSIFRVPVADLLG
ncbi:hypothetical protein HJD18_00245 [Thermoleophilia bacterium SCSIO 60948]|nr:hypothetical protein HJD18_00245 [Thermoleophilia bacterium SCSIO 60948]